MDNGDGKCLSDTVGGWINIEQMDNSGKKRVAVMNNGHGCRGMDNDGAIQ